MQIKPSGWAELFASSHKTEYKFVIDGVEYTKSNIQGTPIITKPYMDKVCIGRCCSGTLSLQIRPINNMVIPKAASVVAYCRLCSPDGAAVTDWVEQGHYYISSRRTNGEILSLMCRDAMMKAGAVYLDYTAFTEWPITMTEAVNEIASVMGIAIDSRTVISTGIDYVVSYPNDLLMSEVLSMIAAAHGGNFIITEKNELRLLPLPHILASAENKCDIGGAYQVYEAESTTQMISRVTLEDDAGNKFTSGDDGGLEVSAKCSYATQAIVDDLCAPGTGSLRAVKFIPYSIKGAYIDPCIELGDLINASGRLRLVASMIIRCNISYNADVSCKADFDDEDEFPYISARDLQTSRYVSTDQKYHGNRIDRVNGFISEYMVNGKVAARLIANSTVFSMQRVVDDSWEDCIYFDAVTQKYVITGNVTIKGVITAESLSTAGSTTINGANITTGILKSKDGKIQLDLDAGTFKVGDKDLNAALSIAENSITLTATSQVFTRVSGSTEYLPKNITITAETSGTMSSFTWYRDGAVINGESSKTLTVSPSDFTSNSATYKVVGKDTAGYTYTDVISIAKISDGVSGGPGPAGDDGYTVLLSDEFVEVHVNSERKPLTAATYSCKVNVFKGLLALTPTNGTLSASYFKVTAGDAPTGITVAQATPGTITISVSDNTAISDISEVPLTISVYNGPTLTAKITVRANMNDVVVSQQASIKLNADNILLRVEKSGVISAINQSAEAITIDAKHLNLNGYVTVTSLENGSTTINGSCITTGTIDASKVSVTNLSASNITSGTISASRISGGTLDASKITVSNLSASSITSGTLDASKITVKNLDASSITSGVISADQVDISSLKVDKIYTTTSTGVTKNVAIASSTTTRLMVGGDGTWNFDYTTIYAGTQIEIQAYDDLTSNSKLLFDTKNHIIRPQTSGLWSLGGNAWFFKVAYIEDGIYLKDSHQCITSTDIGTSLYPWSKIYTTSAYVTNLYINGTKFDPSNLSISKLTYSSSIYASLNSSKQFVPAASTGYYLGNSTYPWQYAYITNLYINGTKFDPSASSSNFAGSAVTMGGSTSYYILCNTSRELRPYSTSTTYPCYLGTSSYYWHYAYIGSNTVSIGSGTSSKLGFFGTTPIAKQTLSTASNNMSYSSVTSSNYLYALNNLIGILKNKYGLIS